MSDVNNNTELNMDVYDNDESNKKVLVELEDNAMKAYVTLYACPQGYLYEDISAELSANGIKTGIDEESMHELAESSKYNVRTLVASGKDCEPGVDGYYEYFFDVDSLNNNKPRIRDDGTVDYFASKHFIKVTAGELLARYHEPTKGTFGFNVQGKLIQPKPGKPQPRIRGKGFKVSEDGKEYTANFDGKVEYRNYDLNVTNIYEVSGDVDYNVGDIDFNGDVNITGAVYGGVTIHAMGNIYIGGHVEDAIILSDKDIIFKDGVNAKNQGTIEAGGNIEGKFFENANLKAKGDIKCSYMLNTSALAYGKIIIEGGRGSLIGGDITGVMGVDVDNCGNDANAKTIIRVGSTKEIRKEYAEDIMTLRDLDSQIEVFDEAMAKMKLLKAAGSDKYDDEMYTRIFQSKIVKKAEKSKYEEHSRELFELIRESEHSIVRVTKEIFPGARVIMDDKTYIPSTVFTHIAVKKTPTAIVLRDYDDV